MKVEVYSGDETVDFYDENKKFIKSYDASHTRSMSYDDGSYWVSRSEFDRWDSYGKQYYDEIVSTPVGDNEWDGRTVSYNRLNWMLMRESQKDFGED